MNTFAKTKAYETETMKIGFGAKVIRDYHLKYSFLDLNFENEFINVFPRLGYLVCNLFLGEGSGRFVNYSRQSFKSNRLFITGLFSQNSLQFGMKGQLKGYAFKLHPVIGYHILKIPMSEITDKTVVLSDVIENRGRELRSVEKSEFINFSHNQQLNACLEKIFPETTVFCNDPIYRAVNQLMTAHGRIRMDKLAAYCCMSERTLRRQFQLKVGLCPQAYSRILKIENALSIVKGHPKMCLEEVAFLAGYYDVSHLAHDFQNTVNQRPSDFSKAMNPLTDSYLEIKAAT